MTITLDQNLAQQINSGMASDNAADLPFPVVYLWAHNGQGIYKAQGGALFFGGWACKAEEAREVTERQGLSIPADWKGATIPTREGDEYEAFTTRALVIAPIARRESWLSPDGQRTTDFVKGSRRHVQLLAYLAERREDGSRIPWGPVVLTAKGFQAKFLLEAIGKWDKATAAIRREVAPGVPAWCFYMALGTFGKERIVQTVGKAGAQSPITPIGAYIPDSIDEQKMVSLFVGDATASVMVDLLNQSQDWLAAWRTEAPPTNGHSDDGADFLMPEADAPF